MKRYSTEDFPPEFIKKLKSSSKKRGPGLWQYWSTNGRIEITKTNLTADGANIEQYVEKNLLKEGSRKHIIARLKEDSAYQEFFKNAMLKFGIESIADIDDSKKKEFFNYIDKNWTQEKNESILRKKIKSHIKEVINEMTGLNKKFDSVIAKYKELLLKKQKAIEEFLTNYNNETDPKKQEILKKKHIDNMNKIKSDLTDAEIKYKTAIQNLAPAESDELLEHKKK